MASFTLTGFSSVAQTLAGSEYGVLTKDAELVVTGADAITATGSHNLTVNGSVLTPDGSFLAPDGTNAVDFDGSTINIFVGTTGLLTSVTYDALSLRGTGSMRVTNTGTIQAGDDAVDARTTDGAASVTVSNSGTIIGQSDGLVLDAGTGSTTVVNTGTIIGEEGVGVFASFLGSDGPTLLRNTGTITGNGRSFTSTLSDGVTTVINDGVMNGNILLGGGNDLYQGSGGQISGTVFGEADNDILLGGVLTDFLDGGDNDDTIVGRGGDDELYGGSGADAMAGNAGDDLLEGGTGSDTLNGGDGSDTIYGGDDNDTLVGQNGDDYLEDEGTGNDVLDGGAGVDTLIGGEGNDLLRGRDGADFLTGGLGLDVLTGGEGADIFVYNDVSESTANAQRDVIIDFEKGVDEINLFAVDPGVIAFRGTAGFTSTGGPELRLQETAAGSTIVRVDIDGNGTSDMEINVAGVQGLTVDDFVL